MDEPRFYWVSPYLPDDSRGGWKAMQFHLLRALEERLGPALRIAPVEIPESFFSKWKSRLQKKLRVPREYAYYSERRLHAYGESVEARIGQGPGPVVFFGALPFVKCRPPQPYFIYTDGAFFIHYWEYNQDHTHARSEVERICAAEAEFLRRAAGVWCSSQWVARRLINEYRLDEERVLFVGTGPGDVPPPVEPIAYENFLVMIAADFDRKGGRLAAEAVALARRLGCDLSLKFIGAKPPRDILELPFVEWCGWLDAKADEDRKRFADLMSRAGAQILLSRADLTPLAVPEAASFSKATIGFAVGGMPEMIEDGKTGWLLKAGARADEVGAKVAQVFAAPGLLQAVGARAHAAYKATWNWTSVTRAAVDKAPGLGAIGPEETEPSQPDSAGACFNRG